MALQQTESYLIRKYPFRETSLIVTYLTRDFGKIKGIVKGARKPKSRWPAAFELLTHVNLIFYEKAKSNLHLIADAAVIHPHAELRSRLLSIAYASYFAELLDHLLEESAFQPGLFHLLEAVIRLVEEKRAPLDLIGRAFEFKLLQLLGFMPQMSHCSACRRERMDQIYFNPASGGIFCGACEAGHQSGLFISPICVETIRFFHRTDISAVGQLRAGLQVKKELAHVGRCLIENRTDRRMKSLHFLSEIKAGSDKNKVIS